jgi:hypothetical protein
VINPHFAHAVARRLGVAKVTRLLNPKDSGIDANLRLPVLQLAEPSLLGVAFDDFEHRQNVIHDLHSCNRPRRPTANEMNGTAIAGSGAVASPGTDWGVAG